ncbi:hypothetical protein CCR75_006568 [Bremia lactucae]|uniref:Wbp11/ELF5/Saf1 N-terminal domain-containing protein n=1 Tax=Bremia lactucae TaxID=4779 RepID=A0A976FJ40_BRELC|nr:hypothetical protein CCR75_006568 [Bremia lactucae]
MAKSVNPMEAYRREQKKKDLKKHRMERQKEKMAKLSAMKPIEIQEQIKYLERQVAAKPADGPAFKRKQELEDTLQVAIKKQKLLDDEKQSKKQNAIKMPLSISALTQVNKKRFQNPEKSIYYHPTMNPFGAPPPGKPQMCRDMPSNTGIVATSRGQLSHQERLLVNGSSLKQSHAMVARPGKRPPLPPGPPPSKTIQVPSQPPLPRGSFPDRPPPPPSSAPPFPSLPLPPSTVQANRGVLDAYSTTAACPLTDESADVRVVAPTKGEKLDIMAARREVVVHAKIRSLVPVALRVQRQVHAASSSNFTTSSASRTPDSRCPVPAPLPTASHPSIGLAFPSNRAKSKPEPFDAFIEEVEELL